MTSVSHGKRIYPFRVMLMLFFLLMLSIFSPIAGVFGQENQAFDENTGSFDAFQTGLSAVTENYTIQEMSFEGYRVFYYFPQNLKAVIFMFHGTGGSAYFARNIETIDVLNLLVSDGIGFVSTESTDRTNAVKWDIVELNRESNADFPRLRRLREYFISEGYFEEKTPLFSMGVSNGAVYASIFGMFAVQEQWVFLGVFMHVRNILLSEVNAGNDLPTFFVAHENDELINYSLIYQSYKYLVNHGVKTEYRLLNETVLTKDRFLRIPGISEEQANQIMSLLIDGGIINSTGHKVCSVYEFQDKFNSINFPEDLEPYLISIARQVKVAFAMHVFSANFKYDEKRFLDQLLSEHEQESTSSTTKDDTETTSTTSENPSTSGTEETTTNKGFVSFELGSWVLTSLFLILPLVRKRQRDS